MKGLTCYACDRPGVTDEHTPPQCFFPEGPKGALIKVPSCPTHNNRNSKDVEYIRNCIVLSGNCNEVGEAMIPKAIRSFKRSPKLFARTFSTGNIFDENKEIIGFTVDSKRFKKVMQAIAQALYFQDFNERWTKNWYIYPISLMMQQSDALTIDQEKEAEFRGLLIAMPITERPTENPDIFKYGYFQPGNGTIYYRLVFYAGLHVYAIGTHLIERSEYKLLTPKY